MAHRGAVAEGRQVVGGDGRGDLIGVDGVHVESRSGEGERVAADAAAEVGDAGESGVPDPLRVTGCDPEPRRLLEPGAGEQHACGEGPELRRSLGSQVRLSDDGGDELGGVAGRAQPRDGAGHVGGRFDGPDRVEQLETGGGQQGAQLGHLHVLSLIARAGGLPAAHAGTRIA